MVDEDTPAPFSIVQSALLPDENAEDAHGSNDCHGKESGKFSNEDRKEDIADKRDADGHGGIVQKPSADAHELQGLLKSLENRITIKIHLH